MRSEKKIAVIGSGLGGLAAACVAAARGHDVTLYDKNEWLGGKAAVLNEGGFRFDMGPTILIVPSVLRRIFAEADRDIDDYLDLRRLDPQWRCFFDDGTQMDLLQDVGSMADAIEHFVPGGGAGYTDFIALAENMHRIAEKFFFWKPVNGLTDTIDPRKDASIQTVRDLLGLKMHATVASTIRGRVADDRLAQMLDHFVQYIGSSPFNAPAVLCGIAHMQTAEGVWYPMGGTRAVAGALARLAHELGVTTRPRTEIKGVAIRDGAVRGVTVNGSAVPFDAVISNMDAVRTYRELVGGGAGKKALGRRPVEPACSGVVLYLGLNRRYEHLAHHDFVFSRDPEEEFDYIYRRGQPAPDPTAYIAAPSITDPEVAPAGGEALYVLVHTPHLRPGHDWRADGPLFRGYRQTILDKLKRTAGLADIEDRIVVERHLTPQDIHDRYNVLDGAIYGLASHGRMTGAFKPGNRSPNVAGLYLAGGAAHPGPGMPMVMMSGWIAADALDQDIAAGRLA